MSKNIEMVEQFQLKTVIFTAVKNHCILHGRVFVMMCIDFVNFQNHPCVSQEAFSGERKNLMSDDYRSVLQMAWLPIC